MTKSIKLTREVISRHTEKRVTKNIERWLDQHSNELKMVDDVYSLSQVLALMWKDRKNKWAISLMRRLLMKDSLYVGDVINFLQRVKSNNSCKHMQAPGGVCASVIEGGDLFVEEYVTQEAADIVVSGMANIVCGANNVERLDGDVTNLSEDSVAYNYTTILDSVTLNKGKNSMLCATGTRGTVVNTGREAIIVDDCVLSSVHNTGENSVISSRSTILNSGDYSLIHSQGNYGTVMNTGYKAHIKVDSPESYISLRECDAPLIEICEGSEGSVVSFAYFHTETGKLEVAVGRVGEDLEVGKKYEVSCYGYGTFIQKGE